MSNSDPQPDDTPIFHEVPIEPTYVFHVDTGEIEEMTLDEIEETYGDE